LSRVYSAPIKKLVSPRNGNKRLRVVGHIALCFYVAGVLFNIENQITITPLWATGGREIKEKFGVHSSNIFKYSILLNEFLLLNS
jgi:hypothetical protein